jgi:rRNA maturation endonuclease Nob1
MIIKEIVNSISIEPFFFLLLIMTFINIFFLIRVMKSRNVSNSLQVVDTTSEALTNETKVRDEAEIESDSNRLVLQNISLSQNLEPVVLTVRNEIATDNGEIQECDYCKIFINLGTAVCPNCGTPLNLSPHIERVANVL